MMIKIKKKKKERREKKKKKKENLGDFDYTCLINSLDYRHSVPILSIRNYTYKETSLFDKRHCLCTMKHLNRRI